MNEEKIILLAKQFTSEKYFMYCDIIDDFEDNYNKEAHDIETGRPYEEDMIQEYIQQGYLPEDFPTDTNNLNDKQSELLEIAVLKSYIKFAIECNYSNAMAICAVINDYFKEYLDKL